VGLLFFGESVHSGRKLHRRASDGLCGTEFGNDSWDDFQGAVDVGLSCRPTKREAKACAGLITGDAHGSKDMGGVDLATAAGRSGGAAEPFLIKEEQC